MLTTHFKYFSSSRIFFLLLLNPFIFSKVNNLINQWINCITYLDVSKKEATSGMDTKCVERR